MSNTVLVTGAGGLLGRAVVSLLCASGSSVIALVRELFTNFPPTAKECVIDLSNDWNLSKLPHKIDIVIHLAQSNRFREFPEGASDLFGVNVTTTAKLLDYARCAGARQFIYASTGGLYKRKEAKLAENSSIHEPGKLGAYFASKLCGEVLVSSYAGFVSTTILRPFFIYGPNQKRNMLLPRLYDSIKAELPIQLVGNEGIKINPIHVDDAAAAVVAATKISKSAIFNIAGPDVYSIREICENIGQYLAIEPIFNPQPGENNDLVADISRMKKSLHTPHRRLKESFHHLAP